MSDGRETMLAFAAQWIDNWNRRDVKAVLSHFSDDATFLSPVAERYVGSALLKGKNSIEAYWLLAMERLSELRFELDYAVWDDASLILSVVYKATLNGETKRACEFMQFDSSGMQIRGEALYGATL